MLKGCYLCLPGRMPNSHLLISVSFFLTETKHVFCLTYCSNGGYFIRSVKRSRHHYFFCFNDERPTPVFCWPLFAISRIFWPHFWGSQETGFIFSQRSKKWPTFLEIGFQSIFNLVSEQKLVKKKPMNMRKKGQFCKKMAFSRLNTGNIL